MSQRLYTKGNELLLVVENDKFQTEFLLSWEIPNKNVVILKLLFWFRMSGFITYRIELSELPLTTNRSRYCKQAMPRLCPFKVRTNSQLDVFHTLIVRSPDADTIYFSSKSTTLTAARCPTNTRRNVISFGAVISHTAIERSYGNRKITQIKFSEQTFFWGQFKHLVFVFGLRTFEQVTIMPLLKRKCSTASQ